MTAFRSGDERIVGNILLSKVSGGYSRLEMVDLLLGTALEDLLVFLGRSLYH
jgi:hypothetical protein